MKCKLKSKNFRTAGLAIIFSAAIQSLACGPFFPNNLLDGGDDAVLVAPTANFKRELERMKLVESKLLAVSGSSDQTSSSEITDLAVALRKSKASDDKIYEITGAHKREREHLKEYLDEFEKWQNGGEWDWANDASTRKPPTTLAPKFPTMKSVEGLPGEFDDYFEGAIAWHNPLVFDKSIARESWEHLLARPASERKYKSTWAAFMLGRFWETNDTDKALGYFRQTRDLAKRGFADSLGLAAASLGLEARIYLRQTNYQRAIDLYLEQLATGDDTAANSLRFVARSVSSMEPEKLRELALNPRSQKIITAHFISHRVGGWNGGDAEKTDRERILVWLEAVEAAGIKDVESAEKFALAAYQANDMKSAQRWIDRARNSPTAQWLQAKLFLRAGKVGQAASLLAKVSHAFPMEISETNTSPNLAGNLSIESDYEDISAGKQALGELGVLRLARHEYVQSLDALLRADFWMDAAYVAERVLTPDELKTYVDRFWPLVSEEQAAEERKISRGNGRFGSNDQRESIRYLLARRLTRIIRGNEAREYYPIQWQPQFDLLCQNLTDGWNENLPNEQRAKALLAAAIITRTNGMELIGTEVEPDWAIHGGQYEYGVTANERTNKSFKILPASAEELRRDSAHDADPEERFHYCYQAAFLGLVAAKLLPNNSEETARILCTCGSWLKMRDPETADLFYKTLVRRCRKTAIGEQADRMRWFPVLDDTGNPIPYKPQPGKTNLSIALAEQNPPEESWIKNSSADYPVPGMNYTVHAGDSVAEIAAAASQLGRPLTIAQLLEANPGLDSTRIKIGQKIFIPEPAQTR